MRRVPDAMCACAAQWAGLVLDGWSHVDTDVKVGALDVCKAWVQCGNPVTLLQALAAGKDGGGGGGGGGSGSGSGAPTPHEPQAVQAVARLAFLAGVGIAEQQYQGASASASAGAPGGAVVAPAGEDQVPTIIFPSTASDTVLAADSKSGTKQLFKFLKAWFALSGAEHTASALRAWLGLVRLLLGPSRQGSGDAAAAGGSGSGSGSGSKGGSTWKLNRTVLNDIVAFPLSQFTSCTTLDDALVVFELWHQTVRVFNSFGAAPLEKKVAAMLLKPVMKRPSESFLGFMLQRQGGDGAKSGGSSSAAAGGAASNDRAGLVRLDAVRFDCWWELAYVKIKK